MATNRSYTEEVIFKHYDEIQHMFTQLIMKLSKRSQNSLIANRLTKVKKMMPWLIQTRNDFLILPNVGRKSSNELMSLVIELRQFIANKALILMDNKLVDNGNVKTKSSSSIDYDYINNKYHDLLKELSVRANNIIKSYNLLEFKDFEPFLYASENDFLKLRNCGLKSAKEFLKLSSALRLFVDNSADKAIVSNKNDETKDVGQDNNIDISILKIPSEDLGLSVRAFNCLKKAKVKTLGDLLAYDKAGLLGIRGLGMNSLMEIEEIVISKGLGLGESITEKALKQPAIEPILYNTRGNYTRTDLDYTIAFKEKYSHYPMIFLLYKSLGFLTEREQQIVKKVWGLKSFSCLPDYNKLPNIKVWSVEPSLPMSINEISNELDLTRQRIHQIYDKANRRIRYNGSSVSYLLKLEDWEKYGINKDNQFLLTSDLNTDHIIEERDFLIEYIQKNWNAEWIYQFMEDVPYVSQNYLFFVLYLKEFKAFVIDYDKKALSAIYNTTVFLTPFLYVDNRLRKYNYNRAIKEVLRLQEVKKTERMILPIISFFIDNENYWNGIYPTKVEKKIINQLLILLFQTLCNVHIENNTIVFEANSVDYNYIVYELLKTAGTRLHRDELFKQLKETCEKNGICCNLSSPIQLVRYLTNDDRIITYGKSSYWGLKEWGEVNGSIREIAIETIKKSAKPVRIQDITKNILESRPDSNERSISAIIWQMVINEDVVLFFDNYIGDPAKTYPDAYISMPRKFNDWIASFKDFVIKNNRFPYSNKNSYEGYLYRWYHKAIDFVGLSSDDILLIDSLNKQLVDYPHNAFEYRFLQKCNIYKSFIDKHLRLLTKDDDVNLFLWFNNTIKHYDKFNDNRKKYFRTLIQYLTIKLE